MHYYSHGYSISKKNAFVTKPLGYYQVHRGWRGHSRLRMIRTMGGHEPAGLATFLRDVMNAVENVNTKYPQEPAQNFYGGDLPPDIFPDTMTIVDGQIILTNRQQEGTVWHSDGNGAPTLNDDATELQRHMFNGRGHPMPRSTLYVLLSIFETLVVTSK